MPIDEATYDLAALTLVGKGPLFHKQICAMLDGSRMFSDLDWVEVENLARFVQCYKAEAGSVLFREGDNGSFLCLLVEGVVEISKRGSDQGINVIDRVTAGKTLGEMAVIDGERRSATATVVEPSTLVVLTRDEFTRLMKEKPGLCAKVVIRIARLLSQRLRKTSGVLVDFLERSDK
jgi:CRP-like cAMP-binding protein